jgi:hypothetical protein
MTSEGAAVLNRDQRARKDSRLTLNLRKRGYHLCSEVAATIGVHKTTLYRWIRNEHIDAISFNGAYYVEWKSLVEHLGDVAGVLGLTKGIGNTDVQAESDNGEQPRA